ncbi:uncharacterized protein LOC128978906 [Indicator indicator]|uniref:uncharacterized protein LOC128978906 n=1 Tax=Indicator indicator TaxID=1002788 RepID=UPI0023E037F1|nr:uncharacterized protein LOC128978906 [Indicator indicator]
MPYRLLGTLLLLLPGAASVEKTQVQQSPRELWVRPGQKVELSCRIPEHNRQVTWYKEKPGGGLLLIYHQTSFCRPMGKYSGRIEKLWNFSFTISPVQREDSGVYYCSFPGPPKQSPQFGDGTRLIVTDATEPKLSILVPVDSEEPGQPPANIPVLCHLYDIPPGWDTVKWQPGGEVTPVTAATMDDQGVLSAWSITWVPAERWDGAAACTATENSTGRTLGVTIEILQQPHRWTAPRQRMRNFLIAALLVLHFSPGIAETAEEEEITEFLYDYAARFSDYLYATVEYYTENTTLIPTVMYSYEEEFEEFQESVGSSLQCHLPLIILLSLLGFLL